MTVPRLLLHAGFTLIELLVAMAIFSLLAVAMYGGTRWMILEREIVMERQQQLHELQRAVHTLNNDFAQLRTRSVRDELGRDSLPALMSNEGREFVVELSHDGWRNPARAPRGTLQRVQYRLEEPEVTPDDNRADKETWLLVREYWPVMDRTLGMEGRTEILLTDVERFTVEYLDTDAEWQEIWPPLSADSSAADAGLTDALPRAIRYTIESATFGPIERLVEVPQ